MWWLIGTAVAVYFFARGLSIEIQDRREGNEIHYERNRLVMYPLLALQRDVFGPLGQLWQRIRLRLFPNKLERVAREIYRAQRSRGDAVLARQAFSSANEVLPSVQRLEVLSATPNADLDPAHMTEWAQQMQSLTRVGIDTDRIVATHTPPIGLGARLWRRGLSVVGMTPYGRIAIAIKWALKVVPWALSLLFFAFWRGSISDKAELRADVRTLERNINELDEANTELVKRATTAEAMAQDRAASLQEAQDRAAELQRAAVAREQRAKRRAATLELERRAIDAEAARDPLGAEWNGDDWLRERARRASAIRDAGLPSVREVDPGAPGAGVLPLSPGGDIPLLGAGPEDAN